MRRLVTINIPHFGALVALLVAAALAVGLLALVGTKPAKATFPGTNGKIAFTSDRDHAFQSEIYVMNPNGSSLPTRLTNNPNSIDDQPSFSADGRKIVFESYRDGNANIYMMAAGDLDNDGNGDNLKRLTKNTATDEQPAFSADGKKIVFASDRDAPDPNNPTEDIYVMKAKPEGRKNHPKNLTKNAAAFDTEPSFSPDGTKIVFTRDLNNDGDENIYVMNVDGTGLIQLTTDTAFDSDPSWSPDGQKIVFRSGRVPGDNSEVFVMDAKDEKDNVTGDPGPDGEGDNMTNISNDSTANDARPAFSPDRNKIVFRSNRDTGAGVVNPEKDYEIFIIDADGLGGLTQRTNNDDADNDPDWGVLPT